MNQTLDSVSGWREEIDGLLRGLTGGFLIGVPLIFTMETWQLGESVSMPRAIAFLCTAYLLNVAFVAVTGFRDRVPGARHPTTEALEATAIAIVAASVILILLYQIRLDSPLNVVIGRIAVDMLPISIGISVTHLILSPKDSRTGDGDDDGSPERHLPPLAIDIGASFAGALFLALSIAPTDEIPVLATDVPTSYLPFIILFSLAITWAIVFEAGFDGLERRRTTPGLFQRPETETVLAYLIALLTSFGVLCLYGRIDTDISWFVGFRYVLLLGVPASIGAAAGRLAV